jgi:hypothetical protein
MAFILDELEIARARGSADRQNIGRDHGAQNRNPGNSSFLDLLAGVRKASLTLHA